jgi:hypothetical protein
MIVAGLAMVALSGWQSNVNAEPAPVMQKASQNPNLQKAGYYERWSYERGYDNWHSRWRSHYRRGSYYYGGYRRHRHYYRDRCHWHSRWRSHYRWASHCCYDDD